MTDILSAAASKDRFASLGDITLCYRDDGPPDGEPLLLLGGLGMQLISWTDELCAHLSGRGFRVIRYDHRDAGRSTILDEKGLPDLLRAYRRDNSRLAYSLSDLAADAVGLLDVLSVDRAHFFGVSMGAMVAQVAAIEHPSRLFSLCSALGTTGAHGVGQSAGEALSVLLRPGATTEEEAIEQWFAAWRVTRSPAYDYDEEKERRRALAAYRRAHHPAGSARQLAAVLAGKDRTELLRELRLPVLVVHGDSDKIVDVSGGRATAEAIPGSRLLIFEGMGHDLPDGVWDELVEALFANARNTL